MPAGKHRPSSSNNVSGLHSGPYPVYLQAGGLVTLTEVWNDFTQSTEPNPVTVMPTGHRLLSFHHW
jgi:hypothetical protein